MALSTFEAPRACRVPEAYQDLCDTQPEEGGLWVEVTVETAAPEEQGHIAELGNYEVLI